MYFFYVVLSNSPSVYTVIDPEGSIKSKNCVDLILKVSVSDLPGETTATHLEHKFRVQVYHFSDRKLIGKRDVTSLIHWGNLPAHLVASGSEAGLQSAISESFQQCPPGAASSSSSRSSVREPNAAGGVGVFLPAGHQPNYVILITALMCVVGLMLPISSESCIRESGTTSSSSQTISSLIPPYLHLTINQKMLAAYALGLVTMVILRP
jgi:hypothetical protein